MSNVIQWAVTSEWSIGPDSLVPSVYHLSQGPGVSCRIPFLPFVLHHSNSGHMCCISAACALLFLPSLLHAVPVSFCMYMYVCECMYVDWQSCIVNRHTITPRTHAKHARKHARLPASVPYLAVSKVLLTWIKSVMCAPGSNVSGMHCVQASGCLQAFARINPLHVSFFPCSPLSQDFCPCSLE